MADQVLADTSPAVTRNFAPTACPGLEGVPFSIPAVMAALPAYGKLGTVFDPPPADAVAYLCPIDVLDVAFWSTPHDSADWGDQAGYMRQMVSAMQRQVEFPPLVIFVRHGEPCVDDGFHRISAALGAGVGSLLAFVFFD